ncbi:MAG: Ig-like domain-containing protein [Caldilineaceae bacterium]
MKSQHRILLPLLLCLSLLLALPGATASAQETVPTGADAPAAQSITPKGCIIPLQVAHIAASIASLLPLPIPGFKTAADMAEYGANLALKGCPPHLVAPKDIVKPPPPDCVYRMNLPLDATWNELHLMDDKLFSLLLQRYHIPQAMRPDLQNMIDSEYGRFENEVYGSYSNIYGIVLPFELSQWAPGDWGDVGSPEIFHYNSDVFITLRHPGRRVSAQTVVFRPGSYTLNWQADTLISGFDWFPTFLLSIASDTPAAHKARKEAAVKAAKEQLEKAGKEVTQEAIEEITKNAFLKQVAKNLAKKVGGKATTAANKLRQPYFVSGEPNATTYDNQYLIIQDHTPPTISGVAPVKKVEAFLPGGASSAATIPGLLAVVKANDDCAQNPRLTYSTPSFWPLQVDASGNPLPSAEIKWTASDNGAATPTGGVNTTIVTQTVIAEDTLPPILLPPPPVIMESTGGVEVALGTPQVFDVADLRPTVHYTASGTTQGVQWPIFGPGIHYVDWSATDRSRNSSEVKQQLVNIKAPGTNLPAVAHPIGGGDTIQAIADESIKITVRGTDGNTPPDPLWFTVDKQPDNGFFIAPLYPYFINDYRMTARYSPQIAAAEGEEFAWQIAADPNAMRDYIKSLCEEDINRRDLPKDFVSWNGGSQKYISVDDGGYTYIYDQAYRRCTPGGSTIAPYTTERISVWDPNGLYVGEIERSSDSRPLRDINFNVGQGTILATNSDGSSTGNSLVDVYTTEPENGAEPIVKLRTYTLWNEINDIFVGAQNTRRGPEYKNARSAAWDTKNNVLYVIGTHNLTGMAAFRPAECNNTTSKGPDDCLDLLGTPLYSLPIVQSTKWGDYPGVGADAMRMWGIKDIAVDSTGAVYIAADPTTSATHYHRIYKFSPATVNADGSVTLGELIGWAGKCSSGPNCNYIDGHSIGFRCTDETCAVEGDLSGSAPGQFNRIAALAIDPKDVLYVADSGNERVQRFNSDGIFAGEARSQSSCPGCSGFVLGDFGSPGNIAVNSNNFYILDIDSELVHVFEASVIHSIDDTSAWVEYQSDTNYVGPDNFSFRATDGFRTADGELIESAPATVAVNVSRNYRPPQAVAGLVVTTTEDIAVPVTLGGYDLDGSLDTLTYRVTVQPGYGRISDGTAAARTFTPEPDFFGEDAFTFVVNDGREDSEPMTVPISVTAANDEPSVHIRTEPLEAGVGFAFALDAVIVDADEEDEHSLLLDWGDGTSEGKGEILEDGTLSGPVILADSTVTSTLIGFHTYTSPGNKSLEICAVDQGGMQGCTTATVSVQNRVDLAIKRAGNAVVPADRRDLTYALTVENRAPSAGGTAAADVVLKETLAAGASYQSVQVNGGSFTCNASGQNLYCPIGGLAAGSSTQVIITVALDAGLKIGAEISAESRVESSTPEAIPDNNALLTELALLPPADFHVTSLEEGSDLNPGDGICAATGGCTLRAALEEANARPGPQTIALGYGVHQLNISEESGRLRASSTPLLVTDAVTITGLSPDRTIVNANGQSRVIQVNNASLVLTNLMLSGGAIAGDDGGAVLVVDGSLLLDQVALTGNSARNGGGVMAHASSVTIRQSAITDNLAQPNGENGGSGGGVHLRNSHLILQNSTFSGNHAEKGGGISNDNSTAAVENVTLVGNGANAEGGGIHATGDGISLVNTILASNGAPLGANCLGRFTSGGYNLLGDLNSCTVLGQTSSNILAQKSEWQSLARTKADTYAYPLFDSSRAVDTGSCQLSVDQQGAERPYGNGCDIGALEYNPTAGAVGVVYLPAVAR